MNKENIAVWGTFDLLHEGHRQFLKKAAKLGKLHVILIPDEQVLKNKGYLPDNDTEIRKKNLEKLPFVECVYIDCIEMGLESVNYIKPHYFCLGYDQERVWEDILEKFLSKQGYFPKFIRLGRYANGIHSKHLRRGRLV